MGLAAAYYANLVRTLRITAHKNNSVRYGSHANTHQDVINPLPLKEATADFIRRIYLAFNQVQAGNATLWVYFQAVNALPGDKIQCWLANGEWDENTVTANSAPNPTLLLGEVPVPTSAGYCAIPVTIPEGYPEMTIQLKNTVSIQNPFNMDYRIAANPPYLEYL